MEGRREALCEARAGWGPLAAPLLCLSFPSVSPAPCPAPPWPDRCIFHPSSPAETPDSPEATQSEVQASCQAVPAAWHCQGPLFLLFPPFLTVSLLGSLSGGFRPFRRQLAAGRGAGVALAHTAWRPGWPGWVLGKKAGRSSAWKSAQGC